MNVKKILISTTHKHIKIITQIVICICFFFFFVSEFSKNGKLIFQDFIINSFKKSLFIANK